MNIRRLLLGRRVWIEAAWAAIITSSSSFVGAIVPLMVAGMVPTAPWTGLVVAIVALGLLGVTLATGFGGNRRIWAVGLMLAGVGVAVVGSELNIA